MEKKNPKAKLTVKGDKLEIRFLDKKGIPSAWRGKLIKFDERITVPGKLQVGQENKDDPTDSPIFIYHLPPKEADPKPRQSISIKDCEIFLKQGELPFKADIKITEIDQGFFDIDIDKESINFWLRDYYYNELKNLTSKKSDQDRLIQEAVENFLTNYTFEQRKDEIETEQPLVRKLPDSEKESFSPEDLKYVHLPYDLAERMAKESEYPNIQFSYSKVDIVLNAAVRILLAARGHYQWPETPQQ